MVGPKICRPSLHRERFCVSIYERVRRMKNCFTEGMRVCVDIVTLYRTHMYTFGKDFFSLCAARFVFTIRVMINFAGLISFFFFLRYSISSAESRSPRKSRRRTGGSFFISRPRPGKEIFIRVALYSLVDNI